MERTEKTELVLTPFLFPGCFPKVVDGRWSPRSFVLIRNLNIFVGIIKILSEFDQKRIKPTISSLRLEHSRRFFLVI